MLPLKAFTPNEENGGQLRGLCGIAGIPFLRVRRIQMRLFKRHWAKAPAPPFRILLLLIAAAFPVAAQSDAKELCAQIQPIAVELPPEWLRMPMCAWSTRSTERRYLSSNKVS